MNEYFRIVHVGNAEIIKLFTAIVQFENFIYMFIFKTNYKIKLYETWIQMKINIIKDNAFFPRGFTCKYYIHNSREPIAGTFQMLNFPSLFNDTLKIFKIYNA